MFREYRNVTPYRFNGKELDTETGLYYYGARYYNPATALWLGVDPLASKYPGVSPYVYCMSNPVKYVDPDGREIVIGGILDKILNFWGLYDSVDKVRNDLITLKNIDPELNNNELNSIYYENIVRESSGYEQRSYNYLDNKTIPFDYEN